MLIDAQFGIGADRDECAVAQAQLRGSVAAGHDGFVCLDLAAALDLALTRGVHHAHIADYEIEFAGCRKRLHDRQGSERDA